VAEAFLPSTVARLLIPDCSPDCAFGAPAVAGAAGGICPLTCTGLFNTKLEILLAENTSETLCRGATAAFIEARIPPLDAFVPVLSEFSGGAT
jgi:hypothetical protein